jgi:RNA polymerase sigma-70 factor, ECF subfamily
VANTALDGDAGMRLPTAASTNEREVQLLRSVASGDARAFQTLYVGYHRRLVRFLMRLTRRVDLAEEIINDTLWVVWCKAGEFRGDSQVSTWIMGIAYRRALKTLARQRSVAAVSDTVLDGAAFATDEPQHTEELHEWLDQALMHLSPEQRLVLELTYYLGHSCAEIAAIMDCPVNTVKTRMFHARRKLRELLPRLEAGSRGANS